MIQCEHQSSVPKDGFLGYFSDLSELHTILPGKGNEGHFFVNGETTSVWIWSPIDNGWMDTNRSMQNPLTGVIDNPDTYKINAQKGINAYLIYISSNVGDIRFNHIRNNNIPLSIFVSRTSIITLFWDGSWWHSYVAPLNLAPYTSNTFTDYRFSKNRLPETPPEIRQDQLNPGENWVEFVPKVSVSEYIWMTSAKFDGDGNFLDRMVGWCYPIRLSGIKGDTGLQGEPGTDGENNIFIVLGNDTHTISCNYEGEEGDYSDAECLCTVYEGTRDISAFYTFSTVASEGITFSSHENSRKVKVENMECDSGGITFIAERNGYPTLRKTFSLAKMLGGEPGTNYRLTTSHKVIRKSANGQFIPSTIYMSGLIFHASTGSTNYPAYFTVAGIREDGDNILLIKSTSRESGITFNVDISFIGYLCCMFDKFENGGPSGLLDQETIYVIEDGQKGETGTPGLENGAIRPRGEWSATAAYVSNRDFRDVVFYNESKYIVKKNAGNVPVGTPPTSASWWISFLDFENVATDVILANNAWIDVLNSTGIRVGTGNNCWELTQGSIRHKTSGLQLTSDGKLIAPAGGLSISSKTIEEMLDETKEQERNLLLNSGEFRSTNYWMLTAGGNNGGLVSIVDGKIRASLSSGYKSWSYLKNTTTLSNLQGDATYTLSFKIRTSKPILCDIQIATDTSSVVAMNTAINIGTSFSVKKVTFSPTDSLVNCYVRLANYATQNVDGSEPGNKLGASGWIDLEWIKLEKNDKATAWSVAPEELVIQSKLELRPDGLLYQGGTAVFRSNIVAEVIKAQGLDVGYGKFCVNADGTFSAQGAKITGDIQAYSGTIAGFNIDNKSITAYDTETGESRLLITKESIQDIRQIDGELPEKKLVYDGSSCSSQVLAFDPVQAPMNLTEQRIYCKVYANQITIPQKGYILFDNSIRTYSVVDNGFYQDVDIEGTLTLHRIEKGVIVDTQIIRTIHIRQDARNWNLRYPFKHSEYISAPGTYRIDLEIGFKTTTQPTTRLMISLMTAEPEASGGSGITLKQMTNMTTIGNNGLMSYWGPGYYFSFDKQNGMECIYGKYGLSISESGIMVMRNGEWSPL